MGFSDQNVFVVIVVVGVVIFSLIFFWIFFSDTDFTKQNSRLLKCSPTPFSKEGVIIAISQKYLNTIFPEAIAQIILSASVFKFVQMKNHAFSHDRDKNNTVKICSRIFFTKSCGPNYTKRGTKHALVNFKTDVMDM